MKEGRSRWRRAALSLSCLLVGAATVPRTLVGRDGGAYFADDRETFRALADTVAATADRGVSDVSFHTSSARFNGEWALGTHQMTALGLSQVVAARPELRAHYLPAIERSVTGGPLGNAIMLAMLTARRA